MPSTKWLFVLLLASACGSAEKHGHADHVTGAAMSVDLSTNVETAQAEVQERPAADLSLDRNRGLLMDGMVPFTGVVTTRDTAGNLLTSTTYAQGKKHGLRQHWYSDTSPSYEAHYFEGRLHGTSRSWWTNGNLRSESKHVHGVAQGVQKQWYQTGALFKVLNLEQGKEQGLQQAFRPNGVAYANYEVRNGRIYGLKRANLCFSLEDGAIAYE